MYLVYSSILYTVDYLSGIMAASWSTKDGATTLMDVIDRFRSQWYGISSIETSVASLHAPEN